MSFSKILVSTAVFGGIAAASLLSSPATHATSQTCVDGNVKSNLSATISNHDTVTVTTKNGSPLCKDLTLYWDSYTMPDNYDGKSFADSKTATPQAQYSHAVISIKAGEKTATAKINLPDCKNTQTDLYYGPEIKTVTAAGHGSQFITGEINGFATSYTGSRAKDLKACAPTTPVTPVTPETPTTPETPVVPETPGKGEATELPSTGASDYTLVIAALLAAGTYVVTRFVNKKQNA